MITKSLAELELELTQVNEYLKSALVDDKTYEVVSMLTKRSSIIKEIKAVQWLPKSKPERREYREHKLNESEKYFNKYGQAEGDVQRKYAYRKYFIDLLDSIDEVERMTDAQSDSSAKTFVKAIREILDVTDFVNVNEVSVRVSLDVLFSCLASDVSNPIDSLQEKIKLAHKRYTILKGVGH